MMIIMVVQTQTISHNAQDHNGNKCFHFLVLSWYFNVSMYFTVIICIYISVQNKSNQNQIKKSKSGSDGIFSIFVDVFNLGISSKLFDKSMIIGRYIKQYVNDIKLVIR